MAILRTDRARAELIAALRATRELELVVEIGLEGVVAEPERLAVLKHLANVQEILAATRSETIIARPRR